jgi:ATP-dependent RNA helicase DeaD
MKFIELPIRDEILEALEDLGFDDMFPIQENAIPVMLEGKNVVGQAKTGTGKTAAFGVPMLEMLDPHSGNIEGFIVAPTRELAQQITDDINSYGRYMDAYAISIYGGVSIRPQIDQLRKVPTIVVGTPGRLIDHIKRGNLDLRNVKMVALDEADRMFDMGFYEDIEFLLNQLSKKPQVTLWSATFDERTMQLSARFIPDYVEVNMSRDEIGNIDITQYYMVMAHHEKQENLLAVLNYFKVDRSLIFCRTKYTVDRLQSFLSRERIPAEAISGNYSQARRQSVLDGFREFKFDLLIATEVAARGLDIDDVPYIINYDIPDDPHMYFHRIGRTARAGKLGTAITFVLPDQELELDRIMAITKSPITKWSPPPAFLF